jgi:hypothetical protein
MLKLGSSTRTCGLATVCTVLSVLCAGAAPGTQGAGTAAELRSQRPDRLGAGTLRGR